MSQAVVVGITGYAQSGKDTIAAHLVEVAGFTKRSFADALREHIYDLNPIVGEGGYWDENAFRQDVYKSHYVRYQDAINQLGYEGAKGKYPEIRYLLQRYGTEVWRNRDPDAWINQHRAWIAAHPEASLVVVPDVRFPNEAQYVDWLIRVDRAGVGPVNAHESDNHVPNLSVDFEVENNGTIEELHTQVAPLLKTGALNVKPRSR